MPLKFLKKYWFLVSLAVVVVVGFSRPEIGLAYREMGAVPVSVAVLMFLSGLLLDTSSLVREALNIRLVVAIFACVFVIFPVLACSVVWAFFRWDQDVLIALTILAAQPSTLASGIVMTRIAEGNDALAVVAAVTTNLSSVLLTPLVFFVILGAGGQVEISTPDMIVRLLRTVLLPVALGQVVRRLVGGPWLDSLRVPMGVFSQCVILGMILTGISGAAGELYGALGLVGIALYLHTVMIVLSYFLGRVVHATRGEAIALILCGSQKTLPAGIYIWSTYFPCVAIGSVPVVAYHVVQMIIDSILAVRFRDRWKRD